MRKDERLKTIFETAAQIIVRGESSWKDYLTFASKIHKYSFDNALLVYAQADDVTALASLAQWNKVGRSVNTGAESIAVCDYDNARLSISYLFDISRTTGKAVKMTDWRLGTAMQKALAERFIRAYSLTSNTFAEVITALSAEKAAENYESCLQAIKGNSQNHIFAELPDAGLEEQLISLMTDSTAYLIGKRCGLSDDEIITGDGMNTISHFNRIPLIAPLGNAVMGNAKEILIEMEVTIKSINTERKATNEREQTESQLHREGRTQIPESANIQRQQGGRTSRQVRPDGNGISEREPPRSVYSFENGWQSDGNNAQNSDRSDRENRTADTAVAQNRTIAAERGHNGTDTPPEQPEAVSGGNRNEGNRLAAEVTPDQPNITEKEPSNDGSFSLPVAEYLERMMLSNLFYPPNFFNRLRYIDASTDTDERKSERIKAVFLSDGDHSDTIDGTPVSVTATDDAVVYHIGDDGEHDSSFKWNTMQELVHGFIENGTFPDISPVMSDDEVRRHYEYILTNTNLYPSDLHNTLRSFLTEQPKNADWTEKAEQTKTAFQEYGNQEYQGEVLFRTVLRDEGIQMYFGDGYTFMPWNMIANIVNAMIEDGDYPEAPQQSEEMPKSADFSFEYQLLDRLRTDCEYFLGNGGRAEKHLWAGNIDEQIAKMRELYDFLPEKPEWLTVQDIDSYEQRMKAEPETITEKPDLQETEAQKTQAAPIAEKPKRDIPSRNFRTMEQLFPDIVSKKYNYLRLESDGFEPLSLEWLNSTDLSMMHTYTQNGDLMYDPDMVLCFDFENKTVQSVSYEQSGLGMYQEVYTTDGYRPALQKELNSFLVNWLKNIVAQGHKPVRAIEIINGEDHEVNLNASADETPKLLPIAEPEMTKQTVSGEQISLFAESQEQLEPDMETIREEYLMSLGGITGGGKQRIYDYALTQPTGSAFATFLKGEYGIGGSTIRKHDISFYDFDGKGISYSIVDSDEKIKISWPKAAGIVKRLINEGRYLDREAEIPSADISEAAADEDEEEPDRELKILDEAIDSHHGQLDMQMTAYMGETPVGTMQYSLYEDVPHIAMIEVTPAYRRQGIATHMLQNLQAQYPQTEIVWGMLTADGEALYNAVTYSIENEEYTCRKSDLEDITQKYNAYEQRLNNGGMLSPLEGDDMNDFSDIQYRLEQELYDLEPTKTFIRLTGEEEIAEQPDTAEPVIISEPEPVPVARNFRYSEDMNLYPSGAKTKYKANVEAIKLLKAIEANHRTTTPEEQIILARYVGWGGLANAFNTKSDEWSKEYQELKTLLTGDEYKAAMESTLTAYYTEPELIRHIYTALGRFGFKGGADRKMLDPAMGTGNFYAVLPESLSDTKLTGVEIDSITGRIARQLYPYADVQVRGYEATKFEDNSFDVAIGNIPFNSVKVYDPRNNDENFLIHDYFIAKTLDLVKPGGIIAFITSKGTMDKTDESTREYIARRAEFIGAVRLPNTAFKALAGTEVTADIIFLKKRDKQINLSHDDMPEWVFTEIQRDKWIRYNSYFHEHPEMILGEMVSSRNMYGREDGTVCVAPEDYDLYTELERAIGNLYAEFSAEPDAEPTVMEEESEDEQTEYADAPLGTKNFTFIVQDDNIYFCEKDKLIPQNFTGMKATRVKGLCEIRNALLEVIAVQSHPYEEAELKSKQAVLNEVYDRFVKKCGAIGSKGNILVFSDDDQFPLLRSIENEIKDKDGNITFEKAQIFYKATIHPHIIPTHADTAEEALYISLNTKLKVDLRYMSSLTGKEPTEIMDELGNRIFLNPEKYYGNILEGWETADEYLSGHVKDKLLYVRAKAEESPELFSRNVTALEAAQPVPLTPADINASIGVPWIPIEYYRQFIYELLDTPNYYRSDGSADERGCITLDYMEFTTAWRIGGKSFDNSSVKVTQTYGTKRRNAYEIYEDCLNLQSTTIRDKETYTDYNGETKERYVVNSAETRIARSKQTQIKEAFAAWLWKDADRKETLLNIYNDRFNTVVPREYDGSHLVFPGMSEEMKLRPHQLNFAARVIYSGTGLAAHEVGAGKTAALIAAGMYMKNIGAIQKPVYVVPNPLVGQWATEFYRFFPNARLLVSTVEDFSAKNRNRYISRIAMGDYDAVILAHSQFERIPISAERQEEQLSGQINQIAYAISRIKAEKGDNWTVKQMVAFQKNLETRLKKLSAAEKKDDLLTFEQLGVDMMFVDEAHMFKNCFVYTKLSRVAGVNTSSSQRAFDMLNKCQYLQEINNGRGVVFATGTPVSNSMSELYVMMRYLEPQELERQGVSDFDSWAATYGEIISSLEITPEGGGYRMRQRFAKFHNLPELMRTFHLVADIQTAEMLNLPRPGIIGGKAEVVSTVATPYQQTLMKEFVARAEAIRKKEVSPHVDNMLKLTGEARLMAIDPRLIRINAPNEPESKLNLCINRIYSVWQDTIEKHLTQLVFCDCGTPKPGQFNVYDEMKRVLLEKGVPENEVVFIHDAKTEAQRQAIFEKTRSGEIRVLIGSTGKLGTGVNVQDRVINLHHLDVPWKPSDITQRNGRGLRQGNQNEEIGIIHYITEGTFDAYLWQIQEQKLRYIMQVLTAKSITRSCEDIDETVLTAAQFKAIATDNPQLLEKMELENRVSELRLLQRNYQNEQSELDRNINRIYPAEIAQHMKNIEEIAADIDSLKSTEGKDFAITLDGKVYDERVKAGETLLLYFRMLKDSNESEKTVGEYRGLTLKIQKSYCDSRNLILVGNHRYGAEMGTTEIGAITRMENMTERIPQMLDPEKRKLSETQSQLEEAKKQYGQPFALEAELSEKSVKLSDIDTELELGKKSSEDVVMDDEQQAAKTHTASLVPCLLECEYSII